MAFYRLWILNYSSRCWNWWRSSQREYSFWFWWCRRRCQFAARIHSISILSFFVHNFITNNMITSAKCKFVSQLHHKRNLFKILNYPPSCYFFLLSEIYLKYHLSKRYLCLCMNLVLWCYLCILLKHFNWFINMLLDAKLIHCSWFILQETCHRGCEKFQVTWRQKSWVIYRGKSENINFLIVCH